MNESSKLFLFPDINVWLALTYERHIHHERARRWFDGVAPTARVFFCRLTQMGLLRLVTAAAVMGRDQAKNQLEAWELYDAWLSDNRIDFLAEPDALEVRFRALTRSSQASPKDWADAYLVAFAEAARVTLVTFDRAFRSRTKDLFLLASS